MKKASPKKTPRKLVLHSQTLRALADLDLARAVGGLDSNNAPCLAVADTGRIACPTWPG
jgi:hypothetical protein